MAFMFENEEAGRAVFEGWRERYGEVDREEAIRISIVRHLPNMHQAHYCVLISANESSTDEALDGRQLVTVPNYSMTMEPNDKVNLDNFLSRLSRFGYYYILPMFLNQSSKDAYHFARELAIRKKKLVVRDAADVSETEMDSVALRRRELPRE